MRIQTKKLTVIAMLSAIAYLVMVVGRIPVVAFLKYDPKDVILTIGGFIYGPLTSFIMSALVSLIEMFTVSDTGPIGALMNVISSCAFACTAAWIYQKKRSLKGAVIGLCSGWIFTTAVMLLWNYFIVPLYMGVSRDVVAGMLIPTFLPFNLLKGGLNAAITMLVYKPLSNALHKLHIVPETNEVAVRGKVNVGVIVVSAFVLLTCVMFILILQGII